MKKSVRRRHCGFPLVAALSVLALLGERAAVAQNDIHNSALEKALQLQPPAAISMESGETEGIEWWLEHEALLRSAWKEWDEQQNRSKEEKQFLPRLDESLVNPDLRSAMDRTRREPTLQHEAEVHRAWEEVLSVDSNSKSSSSLFSRSNQNRDHYHHKVYRCPKFLTPDGIRKLRKHLDAVSNNGIPKRRPNAMNRNGLLLDASIPGGVSGDAELQQFVQVLAREYLRPLGRSFFPEFAGDPTDDVQHYAFTIQYGAADNSATTTTRARATTATNTTASNTNTTDWDLKEHSDASVYTLNINLNLPEEDYSGSSLYFVANNNNNVEDTPVQRRTYKEIHFEPGTAVLHRGMTKHGAKPLEGGQRNNLVIWLHGIDGYVRIAPYAPGERLSLQERWSTESAFETRTTFVEMGLPSTIAFHHTETKSTEL